MSAIVHSEPPWWLAWIRLIPFRELWPAVAILLLIGEQYPFSNFPMYSSLSKESIYFVVLNDQGTIQPYATAFRFRASHASKALRTRAREFEKQGMPADEALRLAGHDLLEFLVNRAPSENRKALLENGLQIVEVRISVRHGDIVEEKNVVSKLP